VLDLFWADINETGEMPVRNYIAGFFWQESREDFDLQ
jgi:hypothetical protein